MDELLDKIIEYAKSHPQFSAPEVQGELCIGYRELTGALNTLQLIGSIKFMGGMCYKYIGDYERTSEIPGDGMDDWAKRRAYFEMRKQDLLRRKPSEIDDEDDEDEEDGEDDEDDEDEENENDEDDENDWFSILDTEEEKKKRTEKFLKETENLREKLSKTVNEKFIGSHIDDEFLNELKSSLKCELFEIRRTLCFTQICAKNLKFCNGKDAEFYIYHHGETIELSDGGATIEWMQNKPGYGYKRTKNTLKKLIDDLMIRIDDRDQLIIDFTNLSLLPSMYYYFYWLIHSLII